MTGSGEESWRSLDLERSVRSLDNIRIELPLAGVGSRILAGALDYLLLFCIQMLWLVGCALGLTWLGVEPGWMVAVLIFGGFLVQWGTFALFEIVMDGRTPGKAAVGLRVMSADGTRAGITAILIRNLFRSLDILVGVPVMLIQKESRRLGDLVAATVVIRQFSRDRPVIGRYPRSLTPRDLVVVEALLVRVPFIPVSLAEELAEKVMGRLHAIDPEFVEHARDRDSEGVQGSEVGHKVAELMRVLAVTPGGDSRP